MLQATRQDLEVVEAPVRAVVRDHRRLQCCIENVDDLGVALGGDIGRDPDHGELWWDAADDADLQSTVGEMIEHRDLLDDAPWSRVWRDRTQHPEAEPVGTRRDMRYQQVRRRAVGGAEVMFAEEDPLEVTAVGSSPQIDVPSKMVVHRSRIRPQLHVERLVEELEQPRLDHALCLRVGQARTRSIASKRSAPVSDSMICPSPATTCSSTV